MSLRVSCRILMRVTISVLLLSEPVFRYSLIHSWTWVYIFRDPLQSVSIRIQPNPVDIFTVLTQSDTHAHAWKGLTCTAITINCTLHRFSCSALKPIVVPGPWTYITREQGRHVSHNLGWGGSDTIVPQNYIIIRRLMLF